MPFAVSCPECGYQFRVPDHVAGQRGKCPKCKAMFLAMRDAAPSDVSPATAAPSDGAAAAGDTTSVKPRTLSIPKPRLLEKLSPAPAATASIDDPAPSPPPAPPAPPRGAPPKAAPAKAIAAAAPAIQLDTAAPRAGDACGSGALAQRRPKKSKLPLLASVAVLLLLLAAVAGGIGWSIYSKRPTVADRTTSGTSDSGTSPASAANDDDDFAVPGELPHSDRFAGELEDWEQLRAAIVNIDVLDATGTRSGTGWLLPGGLVTSEFSLLHTAEAALVTLDDGRRFEVAGVLKRPRLSLALARLEAAPAELPALALAEAAPPVAAGVFIADPLGATSARVLRRLTVSELPAALRPRLPELMRDNDEIQLIEHDGRTAQTPDGRSYETPGGAPLLDAEGRVVGVNLALGGDSRKGYAVGVEELQRLVAASEREEFQPLRTADVTSVHPLEPLPENPFDEPAENPFDTPPESGDPFAAALEKFGELTAALAEKKWRPENADDYLGFAEFAHSATELTAIVDELEPAEQEARRPAVVEAIERLADAPWPAADEQAAVNRLAAANLPSGDWPGVFAYGRCILRPEDFGDNTIDGLPIFAFELPGTEALLVLPIGKESADIAAGSQWLILGTKDLTTSVRISAPAAPDTPRDAVIIRAKYVLGKPTP